MKKDNNIIYVPQIILAITITILLIAHSYFPLNALRSIQIVRMVRTRSTNDTSLSDIYLLEKSISMSPGNCDAYLLLGDKYIQYAFPNYDENLGYSSLLRQKGKYDEALANEILIILDSGLKQCERYQYQLHFSKGYLYYLMDKPNLAPYEFESLLNKPPSMLTYEVMSETYANLQDPLDAGLTLILSLAGGHKDVVNEDINKIEKINHYLSGNPLPIIPNRNAGFGRYSTATLVKGQMSYFGVFHGKTSVLVHYLPSGGGHSAQTEVLDAGNNVQLGTALDKEGYTHIAYLFGNRYIIYANSKDNFTEKEIIDAHATTFAIKDKLFSSDVDSIQLAIDYNNNPQLIWSYELGYIGYASLDSNNPNHNLEVITNNGVFPDIEVLSNGSLGVVYNNLAAFPAQTTQVFYIEKDNDKWGNPTNVSKSLQWAGAANIVADKNNVIHVFYITGSTSKDVKLMHVERDLQGNWHHPEVIADNEYRPLIPTLSGESQVNFGGRTAPSAALLSGNRIAVIWRGAFIDGATKVFGRVYISGKWQEIETLGKIPGQDYYDTQSIILKNDNSDSVFLVWPENGNLTYHEWKP